MVVFDGELVFYTTMSKYYLLMLSLSCSQCYRCSLAYRMKRTQSLSVRITGCSKNTNGAEHVKLFDVCLFLLKWDWQDPLLTWMNRWSLPKLLVQVGKKHCWAADSMHNEFRFFFYWTMRISQTKVPRTLRWNLRLDQRWRALSLKVSLIKYTNSRRNQWDNKFWKLRFG